MPSRGRAELIARSSRYVRRSLSLPQGSVFLLRFRARAARRDPTSARRCRSLCWPAIAGQRCGEPSSAISALVAVTERRVLDSTERDALFRNSMTLSIVWPVDLSEQRSSEVFDGKLVYSSYRYIRPINDGTRGFRHNPEEALKYKPHLRCGGIRSLPSQIEYCPAWRVIAPQLAISCYFNR